MLRSVGTGSGAQLQKLSASVNIAANSAFKTANWGYNLLSYWSGGPSNRGTWVSNQSNFAGVKIQRSGNTHYGWIRLKYTKNGNFPETLTVVDWAWEDCPDTGIMTGATTGGASCGTNNNTPISVPAGNPAVYGLTALSLGVFGLGALRRRRQLRVVADKVQH